MNPSRPIRLLFTGDWQCSLRNLPRCQKVVEQLVQIIRSNAKADWIVVHLGDIKDALNPVDQRVTNFIVESVQRLRATGAQFLFVRGNHDSITTQDGSPSCVPVVAAADPRVMIADNEFCRLSVGTISIWGVPFFRDPAKQVEEFRRARAQATLPKYRSHKRVLVFHDEVEGCERSAHSRGKGLTLRAIGTEAYHLAVSGHIHRPQCFQECTRRVYYAGSPFCVDWGEANEAKSTLIAQMDERITLIRIKSTLPGWYDPAVPGFVPPSDWKDATVRIRVEVKADAATEMATARREAEQKYPNANLVLIPDFQKSVPPESVPLSGSDDDLVKRYLEKITPPRNATREQMQAFLVTYLQNNNLLGVQPITFQKFRADNVLCFEHVELDFDQKGLTLVTGVNRDWNNTSNGSGKTSLVSLPFLTLFGQTFKGQKYDAWARRRTEATAALRGEVKLSDGTKIEVERCRRPAALVLRVAGKDETLGDPKDTQRLIESRGNLTLDVISNAVYLGQREIGTIFGTDKQRQELFSRLLGLDRFLAAAKRVNAVVLRCRRAVAEAENAIASASATRDEIRVGMREMEEALTNTVCITFDQLCVLESNVQRSIQKRSHIEHQIAELQKKLDENQAAFEPLLFAATDLEVEIRHLTEQQQAIGDLEGRGVCPTCGSRVDVKRLERESARLSGEIVRKETECSEKEQLQQANRNARQRILSRLQELQEESARLSTILNVQEREYHRGKDQLDARQRLEGILEQKQQRLQQAERELRFHEQAREACLDEVLFTEACQQVVSRDGLPAFLCATTAPVLNATARRYSEIFADGKIGVEFCTNGSGMDVQLANLQGGDQTEDQSEGEMRMAGIITAFAFRDALVPHNLLILDEPGEGLDAINAAAFATGLQRVLERFQHVIIISHNPNILAVLEPDRRWEVEKRDGVATVKEIEC